MSEQLEVRKWNFQSIRVYVWSIQKYKFCSSVTLILAIATLLLRSACHFLEAKLQEMANIGLILASDVKYHARFGIRTWNFFPEQNFSIIRPEIMNFKFSKDRLAWDKRWSHNSTVTSFSKLFVYFGENLSNSISTPNFTVIELETTKLGWGP